MSQPNPQQPMISPSDDPRSPYYLPYGENPGIKLIYGVFNGENVRWNRGCDVVLRIDIQGATTSRRILGSSCVFVFIVAESEEASVNRLIGRKTETTKALLMRVVAGKEELKHVKELDYVVENKQGELERSVGMSESVIDAEKVKVQ